MNDCLLDLSKAFDKMNHFAFYIKLMNRSIPVQVLNVFRKLVLLVFIMRQIGFCYEYVIFLCRPIENWCETRRCTIANFIQCLY